MSVTTFSYLAQYSASPNTIYLYGSTAASTDGCWVGAFVTTFNRTITPQPTPTSAFISLIQNPLLLPHIGFLFLPEAPTSYSGLADFLNSLVKMTGTMGGLVLWLESLGKFDSSNQMLKLPNQNTGGAQYAYTLEADYYQFLNPSMPDPILAFDAQGSSATTLGSGSGANGDSLTFALGGKLMLSFGPKTGSQVAVELSQLTIPLSGEQAGCLSFSGTSGGAFTQFGLGFTQAVNVGGQPSQAVWYPLIDQTETLSGLAVTGYLDPLGGTASARNGLALTTPGFTSTYRTDWNEKIVLTPTGTAGFSGAAGLGGRLYFVPNGSFTLSAPSAAQGTERRLICGLSAIETLGFNDRDTIAFSASTQASVNATMTGTAQAPRWSFAPSDDQSVGTSFAYLTPTSASGNQNLYRSESGRAPLFAPTGGSDASLLEYRRLALCALPSPQGLSAAFPLLPYEGVTAGQGFAASSDAVAALEYGRIAPTRSALIEGSGATPPVGPNPLTVAVTPQGYVAQFDGKGGLLRLSLGSNKGCKLVFSGPSGCTLPPDLRDVFLAPQQFVVISCNTAANGYASKYLQAAVEMDDWKFNMAITDAVNIAPGDYQTVIVVKAADASIADLAGSPSAWTGYGLFNDTTSDPNGLVLSSWLSGYISQALAQYADGTGLASLENFCQLVTDPDWDGFLFLRVPVMVPEQFDASLDFLLAGVDRSQLMAHHLGSESNRTTPAGGATPSYSQDSAFFGLVHYVRPGTQPGAIASTPSFVPSTADYDFQLLTLSAIFSNDALQNFSSAALVVMNNLFGDDVLSTMPSQQTTQGSPSPTNAILIDGTLQHHDGVPAYRFATAPGSASTFYLSGNALNQVQIDRAVVTLDPSSANGATSTVTFQMSGWLGTLNDADFDLLSYAGVSFSNLALNMSYNTRSGANKSFIFDPSGLALAALPEIPCGDVVTPSAVAANTLYRPGSLAATFPLKLDRFVVGTADKLPADIGYRSLDTQPASSGGGVSGNWYGVQASLPLGSPGALDSANLLSATLLLAWNADGGGAVAITPFIKITGPGGVDLSFQLEGILKFGAQGLLLTKTTDQIFVLEFRSIGISLFSLSFPPAGSTNLLVAGLPDRSLGWFGAYIDPKAPLI